MKELSMAVVAWIALLSFATAQEKMTRLTPDALTWKENPAFPKSVEIATLVDHPTKSGEVVVLRIKFPANFQMSAAHSPLF